MGILRLAGATTARLDLVQEARPICRKLASDTGETVNVAVLSGHSALYLDQVAGASSLQPHNWVGQHIPLHATSNGKILLSEMSADELASTAAGDGGLHRLHHHHEEASCGASSRRSAPSGYAVAVDELEVGLTAIAAPIRNAHGDVIASLSMSGPTFRLDEERIDGALPRLVESATEVSHRLGWGVR